MNPVVQIVVGSASAVVAAAVIATTRAMWRALRTLEVLLVRVERLERHDREIRERLRMIEGGAS